MFSAATRRRLALRRLHRQQKRILCVAVLLQQLDQLNGAQQEETVQCECECRLCSVGHRKGSCSSAGWATEQPGIPEDSAVASAVDSGSADDEEIEADEADDLVRSLVNRQRRRTLFTFELLQTLRRDYDSNRRASIAALQGIPVGIEEEEEEEEEGDDHNEVFSVLSSSQEKGSRPGSPGISLNSSDLLSSGPSSVSRLSLSNPRLFGSGLGKIRSFTQVRHSFSSGKSTEYEQLGESAGGELESFRDSLDRRRPKKVSFQECRSDGLRPVVPHRWYNSVDSVGTVRRKDAGWIGRFSSSFHRAIRWSMEGVGENTDLIGTGPVANL